MATKTETPTTKKPSKEQKAAEPSRKTISPEPKNPTADISKKPKSEGQPRKLSLSPKQAPISRERLKLSKKTALPNVDLASQSDAVWFNDEAAATRVEESFLVTNKVYLLGILMAISGLGILVPNASTFASVLESGTYSALLTNPPLCLGTIDCAFALFLFLADTSVYKLLRLRFLGVMLPLGYFYWISNQPEALIAVLAGSISGYCLTYAEQKVPILIYSLVCLGSIFYLLGPGSI